MNTIIDSIARFKILHIIYWVWAFTGLLHQRDERFPDENNLPDVIVITIFQMACVYAAIGYLIPRYLNRGRYAVFFVLLLAVTVAAAMLTTVSLSFYSYFTTGAFIRNYIIITISHLIDIWIVVAVFSSVVILVQRYQMDQLNKQKEKERLETELNFLKAQINPHFLFNALNSIYVLIDVDKELAANAVLKFSGLLRYQLYECRESMVSLERELNFLRNYISLAQMRNEDSLKLSYSAPEHTDGRYIAPFILIPLIENAFKHVSHFADKQNFIEIKIAVSKGVLSLDVSNTYDDALLNGPKVSGIGLQNVRRRLELLYPDRHELAINKANGIYTINLVLHEENNELHHSR